MLVLADAVPVELVTAEAAEPVNAVSVADDELDEVFSTLPVVLRLVSREVCVIGSSWGAA